MERLFKTWQIKKQASLCHSATESEVFCLYAVLVCAWMVLLLSFFGMMVKNILLSSEKNPVSRNRLRE